jgi:hypothetical protein
VKVGVNGDDCEGKVKVGVIGAAGVAVERLQANIRTERMRMENKKRFIFSPFYQVKLLPI